MLEGSKLLAAAANGEKIQLDGDLRLLSGWHGYIQQEEGLSWTMHQRLTINLFCISEQC